MHAHVAEAPFQQHGILGRAQHHREAGRRAVRRRRRAAQGLVDGQQLLGAVVVAVVGEPLEAGGLVRVVRLERHAEERVQARADGLAETVGAVEREHFGRLGQLLPQAFQAPQKYQTRYSSLN